MSVNLPQQLWEEVNRIAGEQNWSISQSIVFLASVGAESQRRAEANLKARYDAFINEGDPEAQTRAGREMIRAIVGPEAIAKD